MGEQFIYLSRTELYGLPYNMVSTIQQLKQLDKDPIPTKCLEENTTRLSLQGENMTQKRANLTALPHVNGLEEATRPLMSKAKEHSQVKG